MAGAAHGGVSADDVYHGVSEASSTSGTPLPACVQPQFVARVRTVAGAKFCRIGPTMPDFIRKGV